MRLLEFLRRYIVVMLGVVVVMALLGYLFVRT